MESFILNNEFSRSKFLVYAQKVTRAFEDKEINYTKIKNQGFLIDIMFRKDEIYIFHLLNIHFFSSVFHHSWILSQSVLKKVDKRKNVKDAVLSKFFNGRRLQFVYAFMKFLNKGAYYLDGTCNYESQQVCYSSYFTSQPPKCTTAEMDPNKKIYKKTCRKFQNFYVSSKIIVGQWDILFSVSITSFEIIWKHFQIFRLQRKKIRVIKHFF